MHIALFRFQQSLFSRTFWCVFLVITAAGRPYGSYHTIVFTKNGYLIGVARSRDGRPSTRQPKCHYAQKEVELVLNYDPDHGTLARLWAMNSHWLAEHESQGKNHVVPGFRSWSISFCNTFFGSPSSLFGISSCSFSNTYFVHVLVLAKVSLSNRPWLKKCGVQTWKTHVTVIINVVVIRLGMSERPHFSDFEFDSQLQKLSKSLVAVSDRTSKPRTAEGLLSSLIFLSSVALLACTVRRLRDIFEQIWRKCGSCLTGQKKKKRNLELYLGSSSLCPRSFPSSALPV